MPFFLILFIYLFTIFNPAQAQNNAAIKQAWIEMGPHHQVIARTITTKRCPNILINETETLNMTLRTAKSKEFSVNVCEAYIPTYAKTASINQQKLALPKKSIQSIVVIGDTGCRLKYPEKIQACNNPNKWPFIKIAQQAAQLKPDLVIHVGDYYYRETACPAKNEGCSNNPHGNTWLSWQADFFKPAKPLLTAAPWVFVRGNHEDCDRGHTGWFRFLDPFKYSKTCHVYSPLYFVSIDGAELAIMDSSIASDFTAPPAQVATFTKYFQQISQRPSKNIWLLTHKPIWAIADDQKTIKAFSTLQKVAEKHLPSQLELIISGHIHLFAALNFENRPAQIIHGNSGTSLDTHLLPLIQKSLFVSHYKSITQNQFGYLVLEKQSDGWHAEEHNLEGKVTATCHLQQKHFICQTKH